MLRTQMFPRLPATNVSRFARHRNNHEQQCVRNIVSSFATTLRFIVKLVSRNGLEITKLGINREEITQ